VRPPEVPAAFRAAARRRNAVRAWLDHAQEVINAAGYRVDRRRNLTVIARAIAARADRSSMRSRPTLARIQAAACKACSPHGVLCGEPECTALGLRTVQRHTRWMEEVAGLLGVEEPGTTAQFRPAVLAPDAPNLAREWRLITPPPAPAPPLAAPLPDRLPRLTGTPPQPPTVARVKTTLTTEINPPNAGAREAPPPRSRNKDRRSAAGSPSLAPPPRLAPPGDWPPGQKPQRRGEMLAASETLRARYPVPRRLSARHLRAILREWYRSGYTPADVVWHLDHAPGGIPHAYETEIRHPARWITARLDLWRDPATGQPLPPHSARLAEQAEAHRAETARRLAELTPDTPPADPASYAAGLRARHDWQQARPRAVPPPPASAEAEAGQPAPDPGRARGAGLARQLGLARGGEFAAALRRQAARSAAAAADRGATRQPGHDPGGSARRRDGPHLASPP
jgi:hypothetical protein